MGDSERDLPEKGRLRSWPAEGAWAGLLPTHPPLGGWSQLPLEGPALLLLPSAYWGLAWSPPNTHLLSRPGVAAGPEAPRSWCWPDPLGHGPHTVPEAGACSRNRTETFAPCWPAGAGRVFFLQKSFLSLGCPRRTLECIYYFTCCVFYSWIHLIFSRKSTYTSIRA